jgi:hypothetical protein
MMRGYLPLASRWEINIGLTQDPLNRPLEDPAEVQRAKRGIVSAPDKEQRGHKHGNDMDVDGHESAKTDANAESESEEHQPTAEEIYQEEQKEALQASLENEPVVTYYDVITETRRAARTLLKTHRAKRKAMQSDIAAGRRQVRQEQKSIDEQCREIQGKDAHEYSNYIVSKMDLQGNLNRRK